LRKAAKVAATHFILSLIVAAICGALVFFIWFPWPYQEMAGGSELFWLIVSVDIVCGPLLTLALYDQLKSRRELVMDLGIVAMLQMAALVYGLWTVWLVRPLYFVFEQDRFKVVSMHDLRGASTEHLPIQLKTNFFRGPILVSLREPRDAEERGKVLFESLSGGADYGERPDFYLLFDENAANRVLKVARPISQFIARHPKVANELRKIAKVTGKSDQELKYLPIRARKDWVAVLNASGQIVGYLPGDGF
jgi:hypothetical protein